ncbi:MAG: trypsin-like peptidase domain-containing protein, partial [Gammaproteobacteria bacterium]|nr:trypsin-like peptidase domain-containing protein [Gammaproteobacteria bacterium]
MQQKPSLSHMLKQALPGVVNIVSQGELPIPNDPFLRRELEQQQHGASVEQNKHFVSVGSGVIIDAEHGLIITNAHVVNLARNITVTLNDGRHFQAKKIGEDDTTDIAVLQINATDLTSIPFGDSNKLVVGDFVAAIGSPLGLKQSVTSGIVSALHRSDLGIEGLENFIQTDAPINMGNSGGALMNMDGQLVGINTALLSGSGGNIGIGFAIPSNMAKSVVAQILEFGKVQRGLMGVL